MPQYSVSYEYYSWVEAQNLPAGQLIMADVFFDATGMWTEDIRAWLHHLCLLVRQSHEPFLLLLFFFLLVYIIIIINKIRYFIISLFQHEKTLMTKTTTKIQIISREKACLKASKMSYHGTKVTLNKLLD